MSERDVAERIGERLMEFHAATLTDDEFISMYAPDGLARHVTWQCEDGWLVGYTTERIRGGRFDGKFAAMAWRPRGKGARSGKPEAWERVYIRSFSKRKAAKARAEALYGKHSPRWAGVLCAGLAEKR